MADESRGGHVPPDVHLPPGVSVDLPGRGTLLVRDTGAPTPDASTLLLLHGWTVTSDLNWFTCFQALAEKYRVLSMDMRGHGRGIDSDEPFELEEVAVDAAMVLDHLDVPHVVPVGYSMGGTVAQLFWRHHRDRVSGLVLCATASSFADTPLERMWFSMFPGAAFLARAASEAVREQIYERSLRVRQRSLGVPDTFFEELRSNDPTAMLEAGSAIGRFNSQEWIGEVDVPAAVVVTTRDTVVAPARQDRLAEAIPHALTLEVEGDHSVVVRDPERFLPTLLTACEHATDTTH
jgi:3-oxoadipate enol-lactonase